MSTMPTPDSFAAGIQQALRTEAERIATVLIDEATAKFRAQLEREMRDSLGRVTLRAFSVFSAERMGTDLRIIIQNAFEGDRR